MADKKTRITASGLRRYEDELRELITVRRQEVSNKIKVAREQGDLSENADYDAAREEQTEIEKRIQELQKILENAEVVLEEDQDQGTVDIGFDVRLFDFDYDEEDTYSIVGSFEANSLEGKISMDSPLGAALSGHHVGDLVDVRLPEGGSYQCRILEIKKTEEASGR